MNDDLGLTPEQLKALGEEGLEAVAKMKAVGRNDETIACHRCNAPVRIERNGCEWSAECACGWSCAARSPAGPN